MADLTADTPIVMAGLLRKSIPYVIKDGVQLYVGMLCKLTGGYADKYAQGGGVTAPVIGVAVQGGIPGSNPVMDGFTLTSLPIPSIAKGNATSAATGNANQVVIETGEFTAKQVTLTLANGTLAGTIADVGVKVFAVTSNIADATNTAQGTDKVLGVITAFYSATATLAIYDILVNSLDARTRGN